MIKKITEGNNVLLIGVFTVILALIVATTIFFIHDKSLMSNNMDNAIAKGMDPLSVRCSYVKGDDIICIAYAASSQSHNVVAPQTSKK
jgi:hypothetical protein